MIILFLSSSTDISRIVVSEEEEEFFFLTRYRSRELAFKAAKVSKAPAITSAPPRTIRSLASSFES